MCHRMSSRQVAAKATKAEKVKKGPDARLTVCHHVCHHASSYQVAAKAKKAEKDKDQYVRLGARRCVSNDGGTSGSGGYTTAK